MPRRALPLCLMFLGVVAPLALPFAWWHSVSLGLLVTATTLLSHLVLLYGTLRPNNPLFGPVVMSFRPAHDRKIWLTIDDGPDPHDTPRLLDLLAASGDAKATFFVRGDHARTYPHLIREIVRRGHSLGNHTDTHPQATFWCLGPGQLRREVGRCQATLQTLTGMPPRLFRAPVGMVNPFVPPAVRAHGLLMVGWSARGFDGVSTADPGEVVRLILRDLRPGGIVLLHEGKRGPTGDPLNVRVVKKLLAALREGGWQPVVPPVAGLAPNANAGHISPH